MGKIEAWFILFAIILFLVSIITNFSILSKIIIAVILWYILYLYLNLFISSISDIEAHTAKKIFAELEDNDFFLDDGWHHEGYIDRDKMDALKKKYGVD